MKKLDYGQSMAVRILVARDLGIAIGFVGMAEKYLETGCFEDCFWGNFEREANLALAQINVRGLTNEAMRLAKKYYGD